MANLGGLYNIMYICLNLHVYVSLYHFCLLLYQYDIGLILKSLLFQKRNGRRKDLREDRRTLQSAALHSLLCALHYPHVLGEHQSDELHNGRHDERHDERCDEPFFQYYI